METEEQEEEKQKEEEERFIPLDGEGRNHHILSGYDYRTPNGAQLRAAERQSDEEWRQGGGLAVDVGAVD
ncbi:hypothetical protein E2C01_097854 [Portunus trituberculatus]|uniref:Uncharacterized protein n=1 Tax=Portunus trituberculatus TaxID=210409 RepID=A0A5B7K5G2_PORTR|nr:hypothetical protein [Portunus trituberculatus]